MAKFPVKKKVDLSFIDPEWKGAFVTFSALTFAETREFSKIDFDINPNETDTTKRNGDIQKNLEFVTNLLGTHFIEGQAWDGEKLVPLAADDLSDLPIDAVNKAVESLIGGPSANLS